MPFRLFCVRKPFKKLKLREKQKAAKTKSAIWFNDYNECQKSAEIFCEKQTDTSISSDDTGTDIDRNTNSSSQHQIRIAVNFDYDKRCVNKHSELHSSLSSDSTVSHPDKHQVETNELVVLQQLCDQHQHHYTEKAIDVPKEFEENAYSARPQNGLNERYRRDSQYSLVSAPVLFDVNEHN